MAYIPVGTVTLNPATDEFAAFPSVTTRRDRGYYFQLELSSPLGLVDNTYFLVIPVATSANGDVELPRLRDWYPKNRRYGFGVGIPPGADFNPTSLFIEIYPTRRFRVAENNQPVQATLYFDDDEETRDVVVTI